MRRLHLAFFVALIAAGAVPVQGANPGSVTGVVRDSSGVPQIGARVELLRPDLSIVASVFTNDKGQFLISSILPGSYALKAMGTSFLPSLRENVRVRRATVVNLTLNTLYEVMQWLPAQPRAANAQQDDWAWTLRSAANRPLLRWLEDGPLVVVSDGSGARPKLKARLMATGSAGTFGESGERITASVENTPSNSRELLASVDFQPNTNASMESMLGFRQDLGFAGSVQSVAAISIHPEVVGQDGDGLDEAAMRTWENMNLGDEFEGEAGIEQVLARFQQNSPNTVVEALPFVSFGWRSSDGDTMIRYRMTTVTAQGTDNDGSHVSDYLPQAAMRNGQLVLEHGTHQEFGWERQTDTSNIAVMVFADRLRNPVMEASGHLNAGANTQSVLFDPTSGLMRMTGSDYSSAGVTAHFEHRLPVGNFVRLTYANGDALALPVVAPRATALAQLVNSAKPRRVQTYSISLSGTLEGTGTHWRASYRWQPEDTITPVAPFSADAVQPYLNLHVRQPITLHHERGNGIEALLDVQNLLAQGYRPYLLSDGSLLLFAQDQRGIRAGVAFTF